MQAPFPVEKIIGMLNMAPVGRLGNNKIKIFGSSSATEWPHIFKRGQFLDRDTDTDGADRFQPQ